MPHELTVGFNPMAAAERVAHYTGLVRTRLGWLGLSAVICFVIWLWQGRSLDFAATGALWGAGLAYSLIWLLLAVVGRTAANRVLRRIGQGVAVRIGRDGIGIAGVFLPWPAIAEVTTRRASAFGAGPALAVRAATGAVCRVPFLYLDVKPGTIDAAVRAYSLGAWRLDTARLGN
ncbi:MAG: hypothetical protein LBI84_06150 [Propionibacteriaceae bacterium]|jgi:hypothetical protein|nr:hypothetical protein [Propionibacteriaceae bacterium]